ncbi:MAG: TIR domain-containing protein, partial [Chloroflexota bacterium]
MADRFNLSDVMISYSRRDKDFVEKLERAIRKTGREIWIDWEDIPPTVDWWEEIKAGIEAAHTIVFVVSPDSVHSEVCYREIAHAVDMNKRIVPVLRREVPKEDILNPNIMHPSVASHNWIMFRESDDQRKAFMTLLKSLETDIRHVNQHTRLLVRATDWDEKGRPNSLLLRGDDLRHAENWLAESGGAGVSPTQLQIEYITLSRRAAIRTTQTITTIAMTGLAVFIALMIFGALQFRGRVEARAQEAEALITAQVAFGNAETALFEQAAAEQRATDAAFSVQTADALSFIARSGQGRAEVAATEAFFAESTANANQATAVANLGTADARALTANNAQSTSVALQSAAEQGQSEAEAAAATADSAEGTAIAQQLTAEFQATVASAAEQTAIAERSTQQARADAEGTSAALAGIEANQQGTAAAQQQADANRQSTEAAEQRNEADRQREEADTARQDAEDAQNDLEERQRELDDANDELADRQSELNRANEDLQVQQEEALSISLINEAQNALLFDDEGLAMQLALLAVNRP